LKTSNTTVRHVEGCNKYVLSFYAFMKNQVCKLISFGDVAGSLGRLMDGWKVQEMVERFGGPLGDLGRLPRGFPSIRPQNKPLQENLQDVLETYRISCISTRCSCEQNDGCWR